jgi:hypothetical protein
MARSRGMHPGKVMFLVVFAMVNTVLTMKACDDRARPAHTTSTRSIPSTTPSTTPSSTTLKGVCSESQHRTSLDVLATLTAPELGVVLKEDPRGGLTVTFARASWKVAQPRLREMLNAIANADACVHGSARHIVFHAPGGRVVGRANPHTGISMK